MILILKFGRFYWDLLTDPAVAVPGAIKECLRRGSAGLHDYGDYPGTAQYIARAIGLNNPEEYLTGN